MVILSSTREDFVCRDSIKLKKLTFWNFCCHGDTQKLSTFPCPVKQILKLPNSDKWLQAINEEIHNIDALNVWENTDITNPPNHGFSEKKMPKVILSSTRQDFGCRDSIKLKKLTILKLLLPRGNFPPSEFSWTMLSSWISH